MILQIRVPKVYGLLFDINDVALNALDKSEGYNKIPKTYNRVEENVRFEGIYIKSWVYIDNDNLTAGKFDQSDYLERII